MDLCVNITKTQMSSSGLVFSGGIAVAPQAQCFAVTHIDYLIVRRDQEFRRDSPGFSAPGQRCVLIWGSAGEGFTSEVTWAVSALSSLRVV